MTALPSFVELMASLGLDGSPKPEERPLPHHHSRSSSYSSISSVASRSSSNHSSSNLSPYRNGSPAIVIEQTDSPTTATPRDWEMERRRSRTRYSPYSPPISHTRRGSMPAITGDEEDGPSRALSSSPCPPLPQRSIGRRSSALGLTTTHSRRPEKLSLVDADLLGNTPISTFVRRRTPQSSPISPTFPHRKRSSSPSHPVIIPQLPTFVFPPAPMIVGNVSSDTEDEDSNMNSDSSFGIESHPKNLSIRKLRSARHSDSNIASLRRSQTLENQLHHRITPVA
ncbi:hypothetical protein NLI96_g5029 [Meripilus lineatus]|uniref:Uncharacterized protein n=1 Tax=Meripilus lineatus TaxID=2056292 RepID=A0AAD5V941_9APHY|nr:hypothetical protein NLI96_g5029 [Physisporinus lineatus]